MKLIQFLLPSSYIETYINIFLLQELNGASCWSWCWSTSLIFKPYPSNLKCSYTIASTIEQRHLLTSTLTYWPWHVSRHLMRPSPFGAITISFQVWTNRRYYSSKQMAFVKSHLITIQKFYNYESLYNCCLRVLLKETRRPMHKKTIKRTYRLGNALIQQFWCCIYYTCYHYLGMYLIDYCTLIFKHKPCHCCGVLFSFCHKMKGL